MGINEILTQTISLKPEEKLQLIDELLLSLDIPTESVDKEIAIEAQDRLDAYNKGLIKSKPIEEVFAKYES